MAQGLLNFDSQDRTGQKTNWFEILPAVLQGTVTRKSGLLICRHALGVMIQVVLANEAGSVSFTPKILVPNAIAGQADLVVASFTALTADGTSTLVLYPTATDLGTEDKVGTLPREWKFELTYAGTPANDKIDSQVFARLI